MNLTDPESEDVRIERPWTRWEIAILLAPVVLALFVIAVILLFRCAPVYGMGWPCG